MLEHGRSFHETAGKTTDIHPIVIGIVIIQLGNLQGTVLFRRINVIGFTVVIDKQIHITGHLSSFQVTLVDIQRIRMSGQTSSGIGIFQRRHWSVFQLV